MVLCVYETVQGARNLKFTCNLRFDHIDEKMCRVLADCGCYLVTIGLENGNEEFRRKYLHRNMNNEHIVKVAGWLREAGVSVYTYNIVGLPYETLALTLETVKLNAKLKANSAIGRFVYPYPATALRDIAEKAGFLDPTFSAAGRCACRCRTTGEATLSTRATASTGSSEHTAEFTAAPTPKKQRRRRRHWTGGS
jgi:hypothetical protein